MLRLGCRRISAVQNEMIMKKLSGSGKVLPLFGLIVESFAYHAEEFNCQNKVWKDFEYPGSRMVRFAFKTFANT